MKVLLLGIGYKVYKKLWIANKYLQKDVYGKKFSLIFGL